MAYVYLMAASEGNFQKVRTLLGLKEIQAGVEDVEGGVEGGVGGNVEGDVQGGVDSTTTEVHEIITRRDPGDGMSVLLWAAYHGQTDIVRALVARGAKLDEVDKTGKSALLLACETGSVEVVGFCGEQCPWLINSPDSAGLSPLVTSLTRGYLPCTRRLIELQADVNVQQPATGDTVLHLAAGWGNKEITTMLLKYNANINALNRKGLTPLFRALLMYDRRRKMAGNLKEVMAILLAEGADITIGQYKGKSFSEYLEEMNQIYRHNNLNYLVLNMAELEQRKKQGIKIHRKSVFPPDVQKPREYRRSMDMFAEQLDQKIGGERNIKETKSKNDEEKEKTLLEIVTELQEKRHGSIGSGTKTIELASENLPHQPEDDGTANLENEQHRKQLPSKAFVCAEDSMLEKEAVATEPSHKSVGPIEQRRPPQNRKEDIHLQKKCNCACILQ